MRKILIPCDGSDNALRAVRYAASVATRRSDVQLELLYVQNAVPLNLHASLSTQEIEAMQTDESNRVLQAAKQILDDAGVPYQLRWCAGAGSTAQQIARHVHETQCDAIIMGTRGLSPVANVMVGSVAAKVIHLVEVPVTLIK